MLPRAELPRDDLLRDAPPDDEPRDDAPREEVPRAEAVLLLRDSPDWLLLVRPLLFAPPDELLFDDPLRDDELRDDALRDLLLPVLPPEAEDLAPREEDDRVPDDREELLRFLLLDFCAMDILPPSFVR